MAAPEDNPAPTQNQEDEIPEITESKAASSGKSGASRAVVTAEEALKKLNLGGLFGGKDKMDQHKFWTTQPVPRFSESSKVEEGPIEGEDMNLVPREPYPLIGGFEWVTMDMDDEKEVDDVYQLLFNNYVEDDEAMFRFKYSASFLNWALKAPGWQKQWHVGVRATTSRKLVAFISGVPITLRVRARTLRCVEINFLCIHKKLRSKRLTPLLVKEITRRCHLDGIWQAIYTAGAMLPTPVSSCRYYHRSIDWPKLHEVGFSPLPPLSTKARQVLKYKLPDQTLTKGLRPMEKKDVQAVTPLLKKYLDSMQMAQEFTEDEVQHWMLNADTESKEKVVYAYVVEAQGKITDFFSFYALESTVIGNQKYDTIRAAYLFHYATEVKFEGDGKDNGLLRKRLNQLMGDALILAKQAKFDVFNALSLLDNPLFLQEQKFGPGDGKLHYYLYNYRTAPIPSGIDKLSNLDEEKMGGVGVVML